MARQGEAADVAAVVAWLDRIPLGSQPNYDAILRAFPGCGAPTLPQQTTRAGISSGLTQPNARAFRRMQLDALVAIWEHRARDYSTRKAQALDRLMDVAVADFLGGLSVEQICWKYKLWPLKVAAALGRCRDGRLVIQRPIQAPCAWTLSSATSAVCAVSGAQVPAVGGPALSGQWDRQEREAAMDGGREGPRVSAATHGRGAGTRVGVLLPSPLQRERPRCVESVSRTVLLQVLP